MSNTLHVLRATVGQVRKETWNNQEHIVVPVVALVEGVFHAANASSAELYLASEFGKYLEGWNGRPVVIDHPVKNGEKVSANNPEIFEKETIGYVFNARMNGKKLILEAWINAEKAEERGGVVQETVRRLSEGEVTEVSTGLFGSKQTTIGVFNGRRYTGILRDMVPDHLAILSSTKGACSVIDGCGAPRMNTRACTGAEGCECPECKVDDTPETRWNVFNHLAEKIGWHFRDNKKLSDRDIRTALQNSLTAKDDAYVVAVFDTNFVYENNGALYRQDFAINNGVVTLTEKSTPVQPETMFIPLKTNEETPKMADAKKVEALIANEATKFSDKDKPWLLTLSDEQLELMTPEEKKVDPIVPSPKETVTITKSETPDGKEKAPEVKEDPAAEKPPVTLSGYLSGAPKEIQDLLGEGLKLRTERRDSIIQTLSAVDTCDFTADELKGMDTAMLERLAKLAQKGDFSGRGAPRANASKKDDVGVPEPPDVFAELSKKQAA